MAPRRNDRRKKPASGLVEQPEHRRALIRVCGLAAVRALFVCDAGRVERLFFAAALQPLLGPHCQALARVRKPYRQLDEAELARVAGTVLHGGVVAVARPQPVRDLDPRDTAAWARGGGPLLILDGVGNPHNLGAIARSAAFFGLERLVLADRPEQALPSDASYRVAEGGLDHVLLYRARLPDALRVLKPAYRILGTAPVGGGTLRAEPDDRPPALVLGNEESGLDPATRAACDDIVTISGGGHVQSLNVAAAAAILLYSLTRR
jgi:RNA methyltransferase, TrmH family